MKKLPVALIVCCSLFSLTLTAAPSAVECTIGTWDVDDDKEFFEAVLRTNDVGKLTQKTTLLDKAGKKFERQKAHFTSPYNVYIPGYKLIVQHQILGGVELEVFRTGRVESPLFRGEIPLNAKVYVYDSEKSPQSVTVKCVVPAK